MTSWSPVGSHGWLPARSGAAASRRPAFGSPGERQSKQSDPFRPEMAQPLRCARKMAQGGGRVKVKHAISFRIDSGSGSGPSCARSRDDGPVRTCTRRVQLPKNRNLSPSMRSEKCELARRVWYTATILMGLLWVSDPAPRSSVEESTPATTEPGPANATVPARVPTTGTPRWGCRVTTLSCPS